MIKNRKNQKGFTLIELLVVIAIIAVLAVVVVLTLNPAELLRQARDSNRLSDFATMKSAIALYQTDVTTSTLLGTSTWIYLATPNGSPLATATTTYWATSTQGSWGLAGGETILSTTTSRVITGLGWLPINFNAISSGAPISSLPQDPSDNYGGTSSTLYAYIFVTNGSTYKLITRMESIKYSQGGSADVETGDGGTDIYAYEQGTNLGGL